MNFGAAFLMSAMPEGRVFGLDQQTLISIAIQLFNACVLAAALGSILYKPVREFMSKRTDRIRGQLDSAQNARAEAEALKAEYEKKLRQIDTERLKILEAAKLDAAEKSKRILDEARSEAATIKRRTAEGVATEKERLKEETRLHIIEVASFMAEKFVAQTIDGDIQDRLFDQTMAELEEASWLS